MNSKEKIMRYFGYYDGDIICDVYFLLNEILENKDKNHDKEIKNIISEIEKTIKAKECYNEKRDSMEQSLIR